MTRITRNKNKHFRKKSLLRRRNTRKKYNKRTSRKKGGGSGCSTMVSYTPIKLKKWDGAHFSTKYWKTDKIEENLQGRTIHTSWGEHLFTLLGNFFDITEPESLKYKINKIDKELYLGFYNDKKGWLAKQWYIYLGGPGYMLQPVEPTHDERINSDHVNFFAWLTQTPTLTSEPAVYVDIFNKTNAPYPCEYETS
jgi:hypothetical protein